MAGTRRLTWITAMTLAALMIGTSVVGVLAKEQPGRGQGQGQGQGHAAEQHQDGPRGQGLGLARHQAEAAQEEELEDVSPALVTEPGQPTDAARPERECPDDASEAEGFEWLNHGHYVSCVARDHTADDGEHHGGTVREAAHDDTGMPHADADEEGDNEEDAD